MVVSDHHTASPQESIVLPGRSRSMNHNAVPPPSTIRLETAVTITARRTTTAQVTRAGDGGISPSSGANGRSGSTATVDPAHECLGRRAGRQVVAVEVLTRRRRRRSPCPWSALSVADHGGLLFHRARASALVSTVA